MIDDRTHLGIVIPVDPSLPPPRFDDNASANAQPVEPISSHNSSPARQWLKRTFGSPSRTLVFIVLVGLAAGTFTGVMWARSAQVNRPELSSSQSLSEVPKDENKTNLAGSLQPIAAISASNVQTITPNRSRTRRYRSQPRSGGAPRAYRVAVIR